MTAATPDARVGWRAAGLTTIAVLGGAVLQTLSGLGVVRSLPSRDDLGVYSASVAAGAFLGALCGLGVERWLVLRFSQTSAHSELGALHSTHSASIALRMALVLLGSLVWGAVFDWDHRPFLVALSVAGSTLAIQSRVDVLFARQARGRATAILTGYRFLVLAGILLGWLLPAGVRFDALAWWLLCITATLGVALHVIARPRASGCEERPIALATLFRSSRPYWALPLAGFVYIQGDILVLAAFRDIGEVAAYRVAYLIASTAVLGYHAIQLAWMPKLVRTLEAEASGFTASSTRFSELAFATVVGGVVLTAALHPWLIDTWLPQYHDALPLVPILLGAHLVYYAPPYGDLFHAAGMPQVISRVAITTALTNLALNLALVPSFGARGAAVATLISYGVLRVHYLAATRLLPSPWCTGTGATRLTALAIVATATLAYASRWS